MHLALLLDNQKNFCRFPLQCVQDGLRLSATFLICRESKYCSLACKHLPTLTTQALHSELLLHHCILQLHMKSRCLQLVPQTVRASQSLPMQLLYGQKATMPILDQPAFQFVGPDCLSSLALNAQSQHISRPNRADAVSGVIHEAVSSATVTTDNRLSNAKSSGMSAGSLEAPLYTDQPAALLLPAAQLRVVIPDACKAQSTLISSQLPPSATDRALTEQWLQVTELLASRSCCLRLQPQPSFRESHQQQPLRVRSLCLQRHQLAACQKQDTVFMTKGSLCRLRVWQPRGKRVRGAWSGSCRCRLRQH